VPRVKRGVPAHARHKSVLAFTKGQKRTKHALFRRANEAMLKSLFYAHRDRRDRKGDMRQLWITRIHAAANQNGVSYSALMNGLKKAGVVVNRKMLADLAITDAAAFTKLTEQAKSALSV
jgi:large subunit ribosomal protein L20